MPSLRIGLSHSPKEDLLILAQADHFAQDYQGTTTVHPLGLAALLMCGVSLVFIPRRHACLAFLVLACFVSQAQRLVLFGLDFNFLRIIVLCGVVRIVMRKETDGLRMNLLDVLILVYAVINTVVMTISYATTAMFVNRLGASLDVVGMYFVTRALVRSMEDVKQFVRWAIVLAIPVTLAFLVEKSTGRNIFAFLGGVPEHTLAREGRLRVQGAFSHPIVAGCFWASLMPMMGALWFRGGRDRQLSVVGMVLSCCIVVMTASSTPLLGAMVGVAGMAMYFVKEQMRWVRWGALLMVFGLHMVMIKPVWHLIARVSAVGGNSGWHRFVLIDGAINHFNEWWLLGTHSTAHWGHFAFDVANFYVAQCVMGGIWLFAVFIGVLAAAFSRLGRHWRTRPAGPDRIFAWAMGVSVFVHCVNFIGLAYFGQASMLWYWTLGAVGSMAVVVKKRAVGTRTRLFSVRHAVGASGVRVVV